MLVGIVSGIISGLIVAASLSALSYLKRPRLELRFASPDAVTVHNNRLWPIVIGGTYEFGNRSNILCTPDNRGGFSGILIRGLSETNLRNTHPPAPIGSVIDLTYKRAPLFPVRLKNKWYTVLDWEHDPSERLTTPGEKIDGWKVSHLTLRHS